MLMRQVEICILGLVIGIFVGCGGSDIDTTDYSKPMNATQRRNEATANVMRESIKIDRANERAYQDSR